MDQTSWTLSKHSSRVEAAKMTVIPSVCALEVVHAGVHTVEVSRLKAHLPGNIKIQFQIL